MAKPALTRRAALCAALLAGFVAGCGGGDDEETPAVSSGTPGEGGTLVWAVADPITTTDPLAATTRAEEILVRQVNEPLTARLTPPFDVERRVPGLAVKSESSADDSIWTFQLRDGVVFQDGQTPFDSAAVQANATRWLTTQSGRALLPDLVSVDAPSPGEVRFVLAASDPHFPKRLAAPQLGIVSPSALSPSSGDGAIVRRSSGTGTGAFELRERDGDRALLARNTAWWGSAAKIDLGPALDQIELKITKDSSLRLAMLDAGEAQLADELDRDDAEQAGSDPLLSVLPSIAATSLGLERSVRGVDSGREIPALAGAWLTGLSSAG